MAEPKENAPIEASFLTIVHMLGIQAMVALGEIPHPFTKKKAVDLRQAQWQIASLEVLHEKTKGNLDPDEARALDNVLAQVREAFAKL